MYFGGYVVLLVFGVVLLAVLGLCACVLFVVWYLCLRWYL